MDIIYFEISGHCNAKCKYCCNGNGGFNECSKQFIPIELFEKAICRLIEINAIDKNSVIHLYNWGEPFLHPQIEEILNVLIKYKIPYCLSTNGSIFKEIYDNQYLKEIKFSLSGFMQHSYDQIHQLDFNKVISNIKKYMERIPHSKIQIAYFLYTFNGNDEIRNMLTMFPNATIYLPYYNDYELSLQFMKGEIIPNDMYIDHITNIPHSNDCRLAYDNITIDEFCNVLQCCGLPKTNQYYMVGNLFDMELDEIMSKRMNCEECITCKKYNIHNYWLHNHEYLNTYKNSL